jgi:glutathione peroxidase
MPRHHVPFGVFAIVVLGALTARSSADEAAAKDKEKPKTEAKAADSIHAFKVKDIEGKEVELSAFRGKVVMVVNVASQCGLTNKQYAGLESLYDKYKDKGFEILAFPANNFGAQEPGSNDEIKAFCSAKGVSFKLFSKISVKGADIHPLYKFLTSKESNPKFAGDIQWNFQKFLVDPDGKLLARYDPKLDPMSPEVTGALEKALEGVKKGKDKAAKDKS